MGRNSGEIVYFGDWTELANAFNAEVKNRRFWYNIARIHIKLGPGRRK